MADKVLFLVHKDDATSDDIFAVFPNITGNMDPNTMMGYAQVGQHSAVHMGYVDESRLATPEEYASLKKELEGIGYVLDVQEFTGQADFEVRERELKAMAA